MQNMNIWIFPPRIIELTTPLIQDQSRYMFDTFLLFLLQVARKKSKRAKRAAKKAEEEFLYKVIDVYFVRIVYNNTYLSYKSCSPCRPNELCWTKTKCLRQPRNSTEPSSRPLTTRYYGYNIWRFTFTWLRLTKLELWLKGRSNPYHSGKHIVKYIRMK